MSLRLGLTEVRVGLLDGEPVVDLLDASDTLGSRKAFVVKTVIGPQDPLPILEKPAPTRFRRRFGPIGSAASRQVICLCHQRAIFHGPATELSRWLERRHPTGGAGCAATDAPQSGERCSGVMGVVKS